MFSEQQQQQQHKHIHTHAHNIHTFINKPIHLHTHTQANTDVKQVVYVVNSDEAKMGWLLKNIGTVLSSGSVLIFASKKTKTEEIASRLCELGHRASPIHGDKNQAERQRIIFAFKNANIDVLVATDMVSRGLDVKAVKTVINYDSPKNIESYIHRIGRTGRAGAQDGVAYSFVTQKETAFAGQLVRCLEQARQPVTKELLALAQRNPKFRNRRSGLGAGKPSSSVAAVDPAPPLSERYVAPVKKSAFLSKFVRSSDVKVYSSKAEICKDKRAFIQPPPPLPPSQQPQQQQSQPSQQHQDYQRPLSRWDSQAISTATPQALYPSQVPQRTTAQTTVQSGPPETTTRSPPKSRWDNPSIETKNSAPKKSIAEEIQAWKIKYGIQ